MPTSWTELIEVGAELPSDAARGRGARRRSVRRRAAASLRRLRESLAASRQALSAEISSSLFETLDAETWERLEEALIMADVGAPTTAEVVGRLEAEVEAGKVEGGDVGARAADRAAGRARGGREPDDRSPRPPSCDPRGRGQRHRQDDDDRQARRTGSRRWASRSLIGGRRHLSGRGRRAAQRPGRSAPAARSSRPRRARTPAQ